ncbi:MAG: arabinogalactan endo-1,4-beta-galactosidase [Bacteroidetes bacterium]|nr:MAG: arabinogalactan endo-1,4-beta-galactosidase [Bacteroidota bacterium]
MERLIRIVLAGVFLVLSSCKDSNPQEPDQIQPETPSWKTFSKGVDLSYVNEIEDFGGVYSDSGEVRDPFRIFHDHGANTVRVRLWHNPQWVGELTGGALYSDLADVEKTITRAKALGMAVNLDIHYSDTWADPSHQETPEAWNGLALETLCDSVYNYTLAVLQHLAMKGLTPEMVQIGNETNSGMLYPVGKVENDNWIPFGTLLNAGIKAVRDFSVNAKIKPLIILHVAQFQNSRWWIDQVIHAGKVTDFDILGISHYAKWSTISQLSQITAITREIRTSFGKRVMVVETACPWTGEDADQYPNIFGPSDSIAGYPLTPEGQMNYLNALTRAVLDGGATGCMYWEPAWITSSMKDNWGTGSAWDNCSLFDFQGRTLISIEYLQMPASF